MKKTTVELPDNLLSAAKIRAVETGTTLKALIARALRRELAANEENDRPREMRWVMVKGGISPDLDLTNREAMSDWIRRRE